VLGVTEVSDRKDIFEKYNRLVENAARKPKAFEGESETEDEQLAADRIGLYAMTKAGYDPAACPRLFDRIAGTKGGKGNFFTDLFGTTSPEAKRLREMAKSISAIPPSCVERRADDRVAGFHAWQAAVVNSSAGTRRESLHGVRSK